LKDQYKIAFINDWVGFVWVVMPFGIKNGPPSYWKVVIKAFHECTNVFMNIFLDDFIVFNNMSTHLDKLLKCYIKCKKYGISLNLDKCAFMVYFGTIITFIFAKRGRHLILRK